MGNMPGGNMVAGGITVALLIIKKDIRIKGSKKLPLVQSPQKQ